MEIPSDEEVGDLRIARTLEEVKTFVSQVLDRLDEADERERLRSVSPAHVDPIVVPTSSVGGGAESDGGGHKGDNGMVMSIKTTPAPAPAASLSPLAGGGLNPAAL